MHQVSSTSRSFSLSWPPPEQPNGIILDYEIRFYDKVDGGDRCLRVVWCCFLLLSANNPLEMIKPANRYHLKIRRYQGCQRGPARTTALSRFPLLSPKTKLPLNNYEWKQDGPIINDVAHLSLASGLQMTNQAHKSFHLHLIAVKVDLKCLNFSAQMKASTTFH